VELIIEFLIVFIINILLGALTVPFPLSDTGTVRYNTMPYMTMTLIAINTVVFLVWQAPDYITAVGSDNQFEAYTAVISYYEKLLLYGFRTGLIERRESVGGFVTFTSMFMHGDFSHLLGNMVFLWAFGRRVEDACGPWRFGLFYLLAGMVSTLGYGFLNPGEDIPGIGASGAIFGVMGAYLLLFPTARMTSLWLPIIPLRWFWIDILQLGREGETGLRWTVQIPALLILVMYAAFNIIPTFQSLDTGEWVGGANYIAHVTGFLSAITIFLFVRKDLLVRYFAGRFL
jgi:membrane associated rhomboid family serine protease